MKNREEERSRDKAIKSDSPSGSLRNSPSAVIILVFRTSKGFPTIDPRAPANEPAANFKMKGESDFTPMKMIERDGWMDGMKEKKENRKNRGGVQE